MRTLGGQKVLVTGADGFIGSHLVERLLDEGCDVRAFVYYNSFNSWGWLDSLSKDRLEKVDIFTGDIRDPNGVSESMIGIDTVFHLAALIGIPFSYHSPDSYIDTNMKGTLNVLQAARKQGTAKVLVTSTSEVYGTAEYTPIDEKHPLQGQSPYSASKIGADKISESFYRSFGTPVTIVRPFNTYGPRQSARAVIPTIITQLLSGAKDLMLGSLAPVRDMNYISDTVEAFVRIAKADNTEGEEINIASQRGISVGCIAETLVDLISPGVKICQDPLRLRPEKSEVFELLGSNEKIKNLTGWGPKYSLEEGLVETINWFRESDNASGYKPGIYNV